MKTKLNRRHKFDFRTEKRKWFRHSLLTKTPASWKSLESENSYEIFFKLREILAARRT